MNPHAEGPLISFELFVALLDASFRARIEANRTDAGEVPVDHD